MQEILHFLGKKVGDDDYVCELLFESLEQRVDMKLND